ARLLGDYGGNEYRQRGAIDRRKDSFLPAWRQSDRTEHVDPFLCAALLLPAGPRSVPVFLAHVARAQRRWIGVRRSAFAEAEERKDRSSQGEDIFAAGFDARPIRAGGNGAGGLRSPHGSEFAESHAAASGGDVGHGTRGVAARDHWSSAARGTGES